MDIKISEELVSITLTYTNGDVTNLYFSNGQFIACSNDNLENAFPSEPPTTGMSYSNSKEAQEIRHMIDGASDFYKDLSDRRAKAAALRAQIEEDGKTCDTPDIQENGIKQPWEPSRELMARYTNQDLDKLVNGSAMKEKVQWLGEDLKLHEGTLDNIEDGNAETMLHQPGGDGE